MTNTLLIICGPTATGKTKLAATLAKLLDAELVSADSRQVYRNMDIGTGKDKADAMGVPLHLIDVVDPDEDFSVSHYAQLAHRAIADIRTRGKLPIVVGGTGLYIQAVIQPQDSIHIPPNESLRKELSSLDLSVLQNRLRVLASDVFERMNESDRKNPRRLIRKIEILSSTKKPHAKISPPAQIYTVGLTAPNEFLYERIDARVDARVEQGVLEEVRALRAKGYGWELPSMSGLGYQQWKKYIEEPAADQEKLLPEIIAQWKFDEHAYARRQMTWFRKMPHVQWFDITNPEYRSFVTKKVTAWYTKSRNYEN
jgi:tRNA dimethylallyltransferase